MYQTFLCLGVCVAIFAYIGLDLLNYWRRALFRERHGCRPEKRLPQKSWMFGFDMALMFKKWIKDGQYLEKTNQMFEENSPTFSLSIAGMRAIWTVEPENVKAIMSSKAEDFELSWIRLKGFHPVTGDGIFSVNGERWAHSRALLKPCFTRAQIANFDVYESNFQKLCQLIPGDNSTVELLSLFKRFTMDVTTEILFGKSAQSLNTSDNPLEDIADAIDYTAKGVFERCAYGRFIYFHRDPKFIQACKTQLEYIGGFVSKALNFRTAVRQETEKDDNEFESRRYVFLEELAKDTGDRKVLQDELASILMAGRDTTATLLALVFYLLARHPQALHKLRMEVAQLEGSRPTFEQVRNMTYLKWVLNETNRVISVFPFITRAAKRDTYLPTGGGPDGNSPILVEKDQMILYSTYSMHRSPALWGPDATEFRPERWEKALEQPWSYVPFGGGPRVCIGQQLALAEISYVIIRMLQTFRTLENRDPEPFQEHLVVTLSPKNGARVMLSRGNDSE